MTDPKQPNNAPAPEAPHPEKDDLHAAIDLIKTHGKTAGIALGAALIVILGFQVYRQLQKNKVRASMKMLNAARNTQNAARSAEQLQSLVSQFPETPAAPVALLEIATQNYHAGNFELSMMKYAEFKEKYPEHPGAVIADLGRAYCLEALLRLEEAYQAYEAFIREQEDSPYDTLAVFGKARVVEQVGRLREAKNIYEEFIAAHEDSAWVPQAEVAIQDLDRKIRAIERDIADES